MSEILKAVDSFNKKGFNAKLFETMDLAKEEIKRIIPNCDSIGTGGSMTLKDSGILNELDLRGNKMITTSIGPAVSKDEALKIRKTALFADWYLTSTNAFTIKGDLINIDGMGNRVASMIFGPDKVIVLTGKNKLTKDPMDAVRRIKTKACGKNARRLKLDLPCSKDDRCHNCDHPDRMCRVTTRMELPPSGKEVYIFIVNEDWGY